MYVCYVLVLFSGCRFLHEQYPTTWQRPRDHGRNARNQKAHSIYRIDGDLGSKSKLAECCPLVLCLLLEDKLLANRLATYS